MPISDCEGYTYMAEQILSGGALDKKAEKQVAAALTQTVQKAVKQSKVLKWKQPTGKQQGFAITCKVKVEKKEKGKKIELQAQATVDVRLVPSQVKVIVLAASPKKLSFTSSSPSASELGSGAQSLVQDLVSSLMKKQVVKALEKKAAELGVS